MLAERGHEPYCWIEMDKPKKEPIVLHHKAENKLCLNCGFPNRNTDTQCMYCKTSLIEDGGLISWLRQTYYVLRWRWQLNQRRDHHQAKGSAKSFLKAPGYFLLGALLSGVGLYLFTDAVNNTSFSSGLIAILFLSYGIFTIKTLISKNHR